MSYQTSYFTTTEWPLPARYTFRMGLRSSFLTLVVSFLLLTPAAGQEPKYRLEQIPISEGPTGTVQANQMNNLGMVVGFHTVGGVPIGYVYDHFGHIGDVKTVHSLTELIPDPPLGWTNWTKSSCVGINNLGQVVGYFSNAQSQRIGYYLDLDLIGRGTTPSWGELPKPSGSSYGKLINDNQDVLIYSQDTSQGYLYNLALGTFTTLTDPTSGAPLAFSTGTKVDLNNSGQVVGNTLPDNFAFRLTPGVQLEFPPLDKSNTNSINDAGLMAGNLPPTGSRKTGTPRRACRYGSQIDVLSSVESFAYDINNNGDVAGRVGGVDAIYHNDLDMWFPLDDYVVGSLADLDIWYQASANVAINIADRDTTGLGQILARTHTTSSTGSGKNKVTTTVLRHFVLTPELPQPLP